MSTDQNQVPATGPSTASAVEDKPPVPLPPASGPTASALQIWLGRTRALLLVTLCATFGVLLVILPWTPRWTDNPLLLGSPDLREIVASGFSRGIASGLGLLNLWLGFWEAIHYHE